MRTSDNSNVVKSLLEFVPQPYYLLVGHLNHLTVSPRFLVHTWDNIFYFSIVFASNKVTYIKQYKTISQPHFFFIDGIQEKTLSVEGSLL